MVILIDNGRKPDDLYHIDDFFGLRFPPDSAHGNLHLKLMRINELIDEANRRIIESSNFWQTANHALTNGILLSPTIHSRHKLANEQVIYLLRRAADEMVSLIWYLSEWKEKGSWPTKIKIDRIAAVLSALKKNEWPLAGFFCNFENLLKRLNDISNVFKHSFVHSDILTHISTQEPCVIALDNPWNKNSETEAPKYYLIPLTELVRDFEIFYKATINQLKILLMN